MFDNFFEFFRQSPEKAYWGVLFGAMIEGELIILSASALAAAGYLSIYKIWIIAFLSTLFVDQVLYMVGHTLCKHPSISVAEHFPKLYKKSRRAVVLLKKYDTWFILSFRFIYGIRAISPVVIGLCGSKPQRFIPLNAAAALIWSVLSCGLGFGLGNFLFDAQGRLNTAHFRSLACSMFGVLIAIFFLVIIWKKIQKIRKNKHKNPQK